MNIFSTIKEILNACSYIYRILKSNLADKKIFSLFRVKFNVYHEELNEMEPSLLKYYRDGIEPTQLIEAISYIKKYLSGEKINFVLLYVPQESDLSQGLFEANVRQFNKEVTDYDRKNPRRCIREFCMKNNIEFVDPSDYMENELNKRDLFLRYDRHYNHYGSLSLAEFLSKDSVFLSTISEFEK